MPPPEVLAGLIRWTIVALSQANATGNYTVLRELGSPSFQVSNSAAKLGMAFAALRDKKLNLAFVTISTPQLSRQPTIDDKGVLRLVGYYPTRPIQVNFDLSFQLVDGAWRHSDIALAAGPPATDQPVAKPGQQPTGPESQAGGPPKAWGKNLAPKTTEPARKQ
jgi:hypothetical protein